MKTWFVVLAIFALVTCQEITPTEEPVCGEDFIDITFNNKGGASRCKVRVSDLSGKTDGLLLLENMSHTHKLCLNPGYYYVGCSQNANLTISFLSYNELHIFNSTVPYKILGIDFEKTEVTTLPSTHKKEDFDRNIPITGEQAYPVFGTTEEDDFPCTQKGYVDYLSKWDETMKVTERDPFHPDFKTRLEYFVDSCIKIHNWNERNSYKMEFTFYADWHPDEFEEITTNKQRYTGVHTPVPSFIPVYNNTNNRYLMPSLDPCDDEIEGGNNLRPYIAKPQNCSVSWAFAITNSIEYSIKKLYLEEYDQIVSVALSAQELIDCVAKEHDLEGQACDGLPLIWGFDYVFENGIAYRQYYPHTNIEGECQHVEEQFKYRIDGYEKPEVFNKHGLFELVMKGPTAVTLGLDPEFFQYYRNDREEGPYFNTGFWRPSVFGVIVEYRQYVTDGSDISVDWPYFAIESRLRACDSFVFRLPITKSTQDANIAGIAGFALRPIVTELLPTPEPPAVSPTPTPEPWYPIYDPFIYGDNSNYNNEESCGDNFLTDEVILDKYLAVRDAYPDKALRHTRVLALMGMTEEALTDFERSLSKQVLNPEPIDYFVYGDKVKPRLIQITEISGIMRLTQYTRPETFVISEGGIKREGLQMILQWMVDNADKMYFKNLKFFKVSRNEVGSTNTGSIIGDINASILTNLKYICEHDDYFPVLERMDFSSNAFSENNDGFNTEMTKACDGVNVSRDVTIVYNEVERDKNAYPYMCSGPNTPLKQSYTYYDLYNTEERQQCRYTWNWEFGSENAIYSDGPYNKVEC